MRVLVTGGTGFVGRPLVRRLLASGHEPAVFVRSIPRARQALGPFVRLVEPSGLGEAVGRADAVVNLAGEPVLPKRWTPSRKAALAESRVGTTRRLVEAIAGASQRPRVLVSASAVGYYGDRADERLDESAVPGQGFLAELCKDWEAAARQAGRNGVRVVTPRIGIVLGREGGALSPMLPLFRLGLGGPMGSGRQYVSWIHLEDLVSILAAAIEDARYAGPINAVAPAAVPQRQFARALGHGLSRPALVPAPSLALKLALGEAASALLESQRVEPKRLLELGFQFRFPELSGAIADVLGAHPERPTEGPQANAP
ncbi:MAG TPA: TIGR01777 family oxidoreductase [Myxococcales bacterium]